MLCCLTASKLLEERLWTRADADFDAVPIWNWVVRLSKAGRNPPRMSSRHNQPPLSLSSVLGWDDFRLLVFIVVCRAPRGLGVGGREGVVTWSDNGELFRGSRGELRFLRVAVGGRRDNRFWASSGKRGGTSSGVGVGVMWSWRGSRGRFSGCRKTKSLSWEW